MEVLTGRSLFFQVSEKDGSRVQVSPVLCSLFLFFYVFFWLDDGFVNIHSLFLWYMICLLYLYTFFHRMPTKGICKILPSIPFVRSHCWHSGCLPLAAHVLEVNTAKPKTTQRSSEKKPIVPMAVVHFFHALYHHEILWPRLTWHVQILELPGMILRRLSLEKLMT